MSKKSNQYGGVAIEYILVSTAALVLTMVALGFMVKVANDKIQKLADKLGIQTDEIQLDDVIGGWISVIGSLLKCAVVIPALVLTLGTAKDTSKIIDWLISTRLEILANGVDALPTLCGQIPEINQSLAVIQCTREFKLKRLEDFVNACNDTPWRSVPRYFRIETRCYIKVLGKIWNYPAVLMEFMR